MIYRIPGSSRPPAAPTAGGRTGARSPGAPPPPRPSAGQPAVECHICGCKFHVHLVLCKVPPPVPHLPFPHEHSLLAPGTRPYHLQHVLRSGGGGGEREEDEERRGNGDEEEHRRKRGSTTCLLTAGLFFMLVKERWETRAATCTVQL